MDDNTLVYRGWVLAVIAFVVLCACLTTCAEIHQEPRCPNKKEVQ